MDEVNPDVSSIRDGMTAIAKEFASYSFMFTPVLAVAAIDSKWTLKTWKAVQKLPPQVPESPAGKKWDRTLVGNLCLILYLGAVAGFGFFSKLTFSTVSLDNDYFYFATLTLPFVYYVGKMFKNLLGLSDRIIYRRPNGHLVYQTRDVEGGRMFRIAPYVLALAPVVTSFLYESRLLAATIIAAISHSLVAPGGPQVIAGKHMIFSSATMALYLVVLVANVSLSAHNFRLNIFPAPDGGHEIGWPHVILASFCNSLPFGLIAACLRFDYANSIPSIALPDQSATPSNDGILITEDGNTKVIVAYPRRKEFNFHKPYFLTAMLGYLVSALILATTTVVGKTEFTPVMSGFFLGHMSPAVMTVMVGLVAIARGEVKKLWAYREDWYIKPQPQADIESAAAVYEVVKVNESEKDGAPSGEERRFIQLNVDAFSL